MLRLDRGKKKNPLLNLLQSSLDLRVEVPEGGRCEAFNDSRVNVLVEVVHVTARLHVVDQTVALHVLLAEEDGQPLVVGDVLERGNVDLARLLEATLIVPVRVQLQQGIGNLIVLSHQHDLDGGQTGVLVEATVSASIADLIGGSGIAGCRRISC